MTIKTYFIAYSVYADEGNEVSIGSALYNTFDFDSHTFLEDVITYLSQWVHLNRGDTIIPTNISLINEERPVQ